MIHFIYFDSIHVVVVVVVVIVEVAVIVVVEVVVVVKLTIFIHGSGSQEYSSIKPWFRQGGLLNYIVQFQKTSIAPPNPRRALLF